jgi:hypothetical protein
MADFLHKRFDAPDERMDFEHGHSDSATVDGFRFSKLTLEPGWRWSDSVKPLVGTESCQTRHVGYLMSGRLHVLSDDGTETEFAPGELLTIPSGHDAWIVGSETGELLEVTAT